MLKENKLADMKYYFQTFDTSGKSRMLKGETLVPNYLDNEGEYSTRLIKNFEVTQR